MCTGKYVQARVNVCMHAHTHPLYKHTHTHTTYMHTPQICTHAHTYTHAHLIYGHMHTKKDEQAKAYEDQMNFPRLEA